ncbi:DNA adenine methylase [Bradyrhizobium sp. 193]|uniref:DNA adenine methylase n=1 Tax=unclassified Bradyrhizobium TaxID=2631580 RepID=UPI001FFBD87C|nr:MULTISPECIES: DNA adenine methylase [unclassified Bradyrhizobium]MCK1347738.1 DNA adenine methylase [Bradyrhizobium sp. CW11]MCK1484298.1 DNA adenine methylase [Bradyrhizobium sp. 193]MCK1707496.1 DNA adenine methylase [Bradyrhizobium sp. 146]
MKYMGSKRAMLLNGLGELLEKEIVNTTRFVDLFTGSGAVARHVAQRYDVPVLAADLQTYSVALAGSVIKRQRKLDGAKIWSLWEASAMEFLKKHGRTPATPKRLTKISVESQRSWCEKQTRLPITAAYGGHYFSAHQSAWLDALRATLPNNNFAKQAALAALIQAASHCAASPGHTAQPFQPTPTAKKFLLEAWHKDVARQVERNLLVLADMVAKRKGVATKIDANLLAEKLSHGDLVFIDPPYSGVHYSRFYHVLESIASGRPGKVSGVGRYPQVRRRPRSRYSVQTESIAAFDDLLRSISNCGARVIVTFPNHKCSNGLSGYLVQKIAAKHFDVVRKSVASRFSSMGGTSDNRGDQAGREARRNARELILTLTPRMRETTLPA